MLDLLPNLNLRLLQTLKKFTFFINLIHLDFFKTKIICGICRQIVFDYLFSEVNLTPRALTPVMKQNYVVYNSTMDITT